MDLASLPAALASLDLPIGREWNAVLLGYLLGSIPFGVLLARLKGVDLRKVGSGNIGATNASRALGRPLGFLAFLGDFGKGWLPAAVIAPAVVRAGLPDGNLSLAVLAGTAAVCGHCWPLFLGFRGGKAVATLSGMVVAIDPIVFLFGGMTWLAVSFGTGYIGLASIAMALVFPIAAWQGIGPGYGSELAIATGALALLVIWRHRENLRRMAAGLEPRRGRKPDAPKE